MSPAVCLRRRGLRAAWLLPLAFVLPQPAEAALSLERWRDAVRETRILAENDAPAALEKAERLLFATPAEATPKDRVRLLNLRARASLYLARTDAAADLARRAREQAEREGDRVGEAQAEIDIALISVQQGRIDQLMNAAPHAVMLLDGVDRPELLVEALLRTAMAYRRKGELEESVTLCMQAMEIAKRDGGPRALTYAHQGLAISFDQSQHYDEAEQHYRAMAEQARAARSMLLEGEAYSGLSRIYAARKEYAQALPLAEEAVRLFRRVGAPFNLGFGLYGLAEVLIQQGRRADAVAYLDEVADIYAEHDNPIGLWYTLLARGRNRLALGDLEGARSDAGRARELAGHIEVSAYESDSERLLAELAAAAGDYRSAYRHTQDALELGARSSREKTSQRMQELAQRYEEESRQRQLRELTLRNEQQSTELRQRSLQQRWLWTVLGGSIAMLAGTAFFLVRLRRSHQVLNELNAALTRSRGELATQSAMLQSILDSMGDAVVVTDCQGALLLANPAAGRLLGIDQAAGAPEGFREYLPDGTTPFPAGQLPLARARRGEACDGVELLAVDPAGEGRWLSVTARPLTDRDGIARGGVAVYSDVTALRNKERRFRTLAENSPNIIMRYDRDCRRVYVNPAYEEQTATPAEEAVGVHFSRTWDAGVRMPADEYMATLRSVMETGVPVSTLVEWVRRTDGELRSHDVHIVPERGPDGAIVGALAIGHNITALKEAERRLSESHAQLRELAASRETAREDEKKHIAREIHDELGQVLTALKLGISTVRMQFGQGNPELIERLQELLKLTDQSIQVVRNVAARLRPAMLEMGIPSALDWLAAEFRNSVGCRCELRLSGPLDELTEPHAVALFRVTQEALTNIARHAAASLVEIEVECLGGGWRLRIRDDGRGFEPEAVGSRTFGLLGMRERINALGGELAIDSAPGHGTRVSAVFEGARPARRAVSR